MLGLEQTIKNMSEFIEVSEKLHKQLEVYQTFVKQQEDSQTKLAMLQPNVIFEVVKGMVSVYSKEELVTLVAGIHAGRCAAVLTKLGTDGPLKDLFDKILGGEGPTSDGDSPESHSTVE